MGEFLKKVGQQISDFFKGLSPVKKISAVAMIVSMVAGFVWLFLWASKTTFQPLMTNLSPEDSANIIRILREKRIPFKVGPDGRSIEIPPEYLYEFRLELATMGLPESSVVGYEVFDKQSIGTTSFVQQLNRKRALEGELIRTISTIKGVKRARVHLAIPKKSAFLEEQAEPSASVVVDLEPGVRLAEKQVYGIGTLVSRAVEGLELSKVVIVNSRGKILSKNTRDPLVAVTADQYDFRTKFEKNLENNVESMLERIVGEGKVVARVSAELDFSRISETATTYDPDGAAVESSQKNNSDMKATRPGPYGPPGAAANTPGELAQNGNQVKTDTVTGREVVNYRVPQTVRRTTLPTGSIKKVSVAVLVDGKKVSTKDEEGNVLTKTEPWPPEKLEEFKQIVSSALAIDPKRGDILEVKNIEFQEEDLDAAEKLLQENRRRGYVQRIISLLVVALVVILFFLFVVRPFIKWLTENTIDSVDTFLPQTIEELEKLQKNTNMQDIEEAVPELPEKIDPEKVEGEMIKEKVTTLVDSHPQKAALILRDWVKEAKKEKNKAEKAG